MGDLEAAIRSRTVAELLGLAAQCAQLQHSWKELETDMVAEDATRTTARDACG